MIGAGLGAFLLHHDLATSIEQGLRERLIGENAFGTPIAVNCASSRRRAGSYTLVIHSVASEGAAAP